MDEILFRSSQKLEHLQFQLGIAAEQGRALLQANSQQLRLSLVNLWNSPQVQDARDYSKQLWLYLLAYVRELRQALFVNLDPARIYQNVLQVFGVKWTRQQVLFGCVTFVIGGFVGFGVGWMMSRTKAVPRYMQAVQCFRYAGTESVTVVEDASAPSSCRKNEVLVDVKAASVSEMDVKICGGYGRRLRWLLSGCNNQYSKRSLPVTIGRDCAGVVVAVGNAVRDVEVGDEVWLVVPFWAQGAMAQRLVVDGRRVGKKPKGVGFEAACSLPYAGTLALNALRTAELNCKTAPGKRVFVHGACTPSGCVLVQVLKCWGAHVTATCTNRSAPVAKALGVADIVELPDDASQKTEDAKVMIKEMELRDPFAVIIVTTEAGLAAADFYSYCTTNGRVVSTMPPCLYSDRCGSFVGALIWGYVKAQCLLSMFGASSPETYYNETHICASTLDALCRFVEQGALQTVVDKVLPPSEIESALRHIRSRNSIGSTVISFR